MRRTNPIDTFNRKIHKTKTCWLWPKSKKRRPVIYGGGSRKGTYVSVFSYQTFIGPIHKGQYVLHTCDNPYCANPKHLFLGTQLDNMRDMVSKGRQNRPKGESNGRAKLIDDDIRYIRKNYIPRHPALRYVYQASRTMPSDQLQTAINDFPHKVEVVWYPKNKNPPVGFIWVTDGTLVWPVYTDGAIPENAYLVRAWTDACVPKPPKEIPK